MTDRFEREVVVIGGCGHVGLPLGLAFAEAGLRVAFYDLNSTSVAHPAAIASAEHVVIVIGTPVDGHLNPNPTVVTVAVEELASHLREGQLVVLRSLYSSARATRRIHVSAASAHYCD